jgi:RNA polymerase-binding transcription factor DksA
MGNLWEDVEQEKDRRWSAIAEQRDYHCKVCGSLIGREDRDAYFESRMCCHCAYAVSKDD